MGIKTRREKEKEIARSIEQKADNKELISLRYDSLVDEHSDENYSEEEISDIIDNLEEESPFDKSDINFEIIYPESSSEDLFRDFEFRRKQTTTGKIVMGSYILYLGILGTDFINQSLEITNGKFIGISLFSIISAVVLGTITLTIGDIAERNIPIVKKYKMVIYPFVGLMGLTLAITYAAASFYSMNIPLTALASIPPTSLLAAVSLATFIKKFNIGE